MDVTFPWSRPEFDKSAKRVFSGIMKGISALPIVIVLIGLAASALAILFAVTLPTKQSANDFNSKAALPVQGDAIATTSRAQEEEDPTSEWYTHTNPDLGYSFRYPAHWHVEEVDFTNPDWKLIDGKPRHFRYVEITSGGFQIQVGFKLIGEGSEIFPKAYRSGMPGSEIRVEEGPDVNGVHAKRMVLMDIVEGAAQIRLVQYCAPMGPDDFYSCDLLQVGESTSSLIVLVGNPEESAEDWTDAIDTADALVASIRGL